MKVSNNYREGYCHTLTGKLDISVNNKAKLANLGLHAYYCVTGIKHGKSTDDGLIPTLKKCYEIIDL